MNSFQELALHGYHWAATPWRAHRLRQLRRDGRVPLCVLFYHRIADQHPNDWTISRRQFARQLKWMTESVQLISLAEIQQRLNDGLNEQVAVHLTFDDGYAENCEFAIPLLLKQKIPFTYFVSLDFVLSGRPFPHDEAAGQPLPPNTIDQLRAMAAAGIEIGAHTRNHTDLGKVTNPDTLRDELLTATEELSELIDRPVRYFAFPYGQPSNLNAHAAKMARASGLAGVCSAYGAYNHPGDDPFHIQRIHGDPEFVRLKNWLSIDPRKLSIGRDFQMPSPSPSPSLPETVAS